MRHTPHHKQKGNLKKRRTLNIDQQPKIEAGMLNRLPVERIKLQTECDPKERKWKKDCREKEYIGMILKDGNRRKKGRLGFAFDPSPTGWRTNHPLSVGGVAAAVACPAEQRQSHPSCPATASPKEGFIVIAS
ncbi:unnamed protein product [Musa acuminata subsp. burmannicoides]